MNLEIAGKNALVCASSKGIGLAIAQSLAREGVNLFLCARNRDHLQTAAAAIQAGSQVRVAFAEVDLAQTAAVAKLAQTAAAELGPIDILINNVGGPAPSTAAATATAAWQKGFEQLFLSSTQLTQLILPEMQRRGFGRIITITSLSVVEPIANLCISSAMRAAVTAFCKTLAVEVAPRGITVNTVMPGIIHTDRIQYLRQEKAKRDGTTLGEEMEKTAKDIPMGRIGAVEEIADAVTFLASAKASYITGVNLQVDGGLRKSWV